jgi:hypothetical protein
VRRAAKIDANQPEIVQALRKAGATVQTLAMVGAGCPDLLVGFQGRNLLMEVKDGRLPPSRRRLTTDEQNWCVAWRGQVAIVKSVDDALKLIMNSRPGVVLGDRAG